MPRHHSTPRARLFLRSLEQRLVPTVYTVDSLLDTVDGTDGLLSLREAVIAANANPGMDTVQLPAGTLNITRAGSKEDAALTGDLDITSDLTIIGMGSKLSIVNGNQLDRILHTVNSVTLFVQGLTLQFGKAPGNEIFAGSPQARGGAILSQGTLTLDDCRIENCIAEGESISEAKTLFGLRGVGGGVAHSNGAVTLNGCTFLNNRSQGGFALATAGNGTGGTAFGGALTIENGGAVNVNSSLFQGNSTYGGGAAAPTGIATVGQANGGAISAVGGTLALQQSYLSANSAREGGGIYAENLAAVLIENSTLANNIANAGRGGALITVNCVTLPQRLFNSTLTNNSAATFGGAICVPGSNGRLEITHCTIVENDAEKGAAAFIETPANNKAVDLEGTVVVANKSNVGLEIHAFSIAADYCVLGSTISQGVIGSDNQTGISNHDLGPLTSNGGPTPTRMPIPAGVLVDRGTLNGSNLGNDQRGVGYPRVVGSAADVGAVELPPSPLTATTTLSPVVNAGGTIHAIQVKYMDEIGVDVSTLNTGDVLVLGPNGFAGTPVFAGVDLAGNGTPRTATYVLEAPGGFWNGDDNGDYTVKLNANQVADVTGAFAYPATLGTFSVTLARVFVVDSKLTFSSALSQANALKGTHDTITFSPTYFKTPTVIGIGQDTISDSVTIQGVGTSLISFRSPSSTSMFTQLSGTTVRFTGFTFDGAIGKLETGGVTLYGDESEFSDCNFINFGYGAINNLRSKSLIVRNSQFTNNQRNANGGAAIFVSNIQNSPTVLVENSSFKNNFSTSGYGGAIQMSGVDITLHQCVFENNSAQNGGAVWAHANVTVEGCAFSNNTATDYYGGALNVLANPNMTVRFSTFVNNKATNAQYGSGGAVSAGSIIDTGVFTMNDTLFRGNVAGTDGGGAQLDFDQVTASNCWFDANVAYRGGGVKVLGKATLVSSTWSANVATGTEGGGINTGGGALTIQNSTFSANQSSNAFTGGGGAVSFSDFERPVTIQNSTFVDNTIKSGSGPSVWVKAATSVGISSTVMAGGSWNGTIAGELSSAAPVLLTHSSLSTVTGFTQVSGSGSNLMPGIDVKLGPLGAFGGPTPTHTLLSGSPLLNSGSNVGGLFTDQKGLPRNQNGGVDIGSVEGSATIPLAIAKLNDVAPPTVSFYVLTVTYYDDVAIKAATLGTGDVRITGPNAFSIVPTLINAAPNSDAQSIVASYQFQAPGGFWDGVDNGEYTLLVQANEVFDSAGNAIPGMAIDTFFVAFPTSIVVSNDADAGPGSLRAALITANATVSSDVIVFERVFFSVPRSINLMSGPLAITESVSIFGPGSNLLSINGNYAQQLMTVQALTTIPINVGISGMAMVHGYAAGNQDLGIGGAIYDWGAHLVISDCHFSANESQSNGGAIAISSTSPPVNLVVDNCQFVRNTAPGNQASGGAISMGPNVNANIRQSIFRENESYLLGGAIYAPFNIGVGTLEMSACEVTSNKSGLFGNIYIKGGITAGLSFINCTMSMNTRGAIFVRDSAGQVLVRHCTITANIGAGTSGLATENCSVLIEGSIISGNTSGSGYSDVVATKVAAKGSAFGVAPVYSFTDLGGNLPFGANLKLGPLGDYGGGIRTYPLLAGSPCLDAAGTVSSGLFVDQRGFTRPVGIADIGAFESQTIGTAPTALMPASGPIRLGDTTQRVSIEFRDELSVDSASIGAGDVEIHGPNGFNALASFQSSTFAGDAPVISASYVFTPPGGSWDNSDNGAYTIRLRGNEISDATGNVSNSQVISSFTVDFRRHAVVSNASDTGAGSLRAAISLANSIFTIDTVSFDPTVFATPQTILLNTGAMTISESLTILGPGSDRVTLHGLNSYRHFTISIPEPVISSVAISGLTLAFGHAIGVNESGRGGSIYSNQDSVYLSQLVFDSNQSDSGGGAVWMSSQVGFGSLFIEDCSFINNKSIGGGAIGFTGGNDFEVIRSRFIGNVTSNFGGSTGGAIGVFPDLQSGRVVIDACEFSENQSDVGGALHIGGGRFEHVISNSTFSANKSSSIGGAIALENDQTLHIFNSTITNNVSGVGGGLKAPTTGGSIWLESTVVAGNSATYSPDISSTGSVKAAYSAIGTSAGYTLTDLGNNLPVGSVLKLGPLADNGGPTRTHAVLPGSPLINAGINTLNLSNDQRGASRTFGKATDIGAYEAVIPPTATVRIDDGTGQRSKVRSLRVTVSDTVMLPVNPANAFVLQRTGPGAPVGTIALGVLQSFNEFTLTFIDSTFVGSGNSLIEGLYQLTILADSIQGLGGKLDGNNDLVGGDNLVVDFHRLFGDFDGNGTVASADFNAFRLAYGTTGPSIFDFDGDNQVSASDFNQFRTRYGVTLVP